MPLSPIAMGEEQLFPAVESSIIMSSFRYLLSSAGEEAPPQAAVLLVRRR